jgi:DNA (cytosine-5)-methyltransferase 1
MPKNNLITFGSLFSGIGGFDLGFERAGMQCRWQCEIDKKAQAVLRRHFEGVKLYDDVRSITRDAEPVDLICGGFPCQDLSITGKRKGLAGERSGLWYEYARIICEIEPRWVVVENVWNLLAINDGRDFGIVLRDLAKCGFDATWRVLTARAFGAPHLRKRVFIIANRDPQRIKGFWQKPIRRVKEFSWCEGIRGVEDLRERSDIPFPLVRRKDDGTSFRVDACGNAVVPQIAQWIGERIIEVDSENKE